MNTQELTDDQLETVTAGKVLKDFLTMAGAPYTAFLPLAKAMQSK